MIISFVVTCSLVLIWCIFHVGRSRPGWGKEQCKPAWWPAGVPFTDINNSKNRPKRNDLILIMESYRDWNLQDQPEEFVADSQPHDPQIPIPVESTPADLYDVSLRQRNGMQIYCRCFVG